MASFVYNRGALGLTALDASDIDWVSDTVQARLINTGVTPNKDDTSMTPYTSYKIGTDQALASRTRTEDTANDRINFNCSSSTTWSSVTTGSTVCFVVIYKFVTDDAGSTPIACLDVTDTPTNGGDITISYSGNVVFYLQQ
jgi:hypothetical protein